MIYYRIRRGVYPYPNREFRSETGPDLHGKVTGLVYITPRVVATGKRTYNVNELWLIADFRKEKVA